MKAAAERYLRDLQRRIRWMRVVRALSAVAYTGEAAALVVTLGAGLRASALIMAFAVAVGTAVMLSQSLLIRRLRREEARLRHEARPRPDYSAIAAMETQIWGHPFRHEGAPGGDTP